MRRYLPLKFVSWLLLLALLTVGLGFAHNCAHAAQIDCQPGAARITDTAGHGEPCTPLEDHQDYDGCDCCSACSCHASLVIEPFTLQYNPIVLQLRSPSVFGYLPEVHLSKFIPPQNLA